VTKDIPANVIAVGNPCRVAREIGERDREYYFRDLKMDFPYTSDKITSEIKNSAIADCILL
jgi:galactoside O-acetyltransferase